MGKWLMKLQLGVWWASPESWGLTYVIKSFSACSSLRILFYFKNLFVRFLYKSKVLTHYLIFVDYLKFFSYSAILILLLDILKLTLLRNSSFFLFLNSHPLALSPLATIACSISIGLFLFYVVYSFILGYFRFHI